MDYSSLEDKDLCSLIDNRWNSSEEIWSEIKTITDNNTKIYDGKPKWASRLPKSKPATLANRIFVNTESVINSLIANPPQPNALPTRQTPEAMKVSRAIEKTLGIQYDKLNVKEALRQSLRDLYFSRLFAWKVYWDHKLDNFNVKRLDPNKVRFSSCAKNEEESEFVIEEVDTTIGNLIAKFEDKKEEIIKLSGVQEKDILIKNPKCTYKECWIGDWLICKYKTLILEKTKNPYWDWDGLLMNEEEYKNFRFDEETPFHKKIKSLKEATVGEGEEKQYVQDMRKQEMEDSEGMEEEEATEYDSYLFNYFDRPRKPYIFATILNNDDKPIGRTSFIEQSAPLQEGVERRKYDIDRNAEMVNGITKVDSSVMTKNQAQALRYEAGGLIWGKGVTTGVVRESGTALPAFVFEDMQDSRNEIDNIMAASSAFRGERQGQETKAGRLALIEQSFLRLNELVQVIDYVNQELFAWWTQLMKVRYTEPHLVKEMGKDNALEVFSIMQDDIEDGIEVRVIPGKTLPKDRQFMFERAQQDFANGALSLPDYLEEAGYDDAKEKATNKVEFDMDPASFLGIQPPAPAPPTPDLTSTIPGAQAPPVAPPPQGAPALSQIPQV